MGLTKSVHPYCRLAIITMQTMPKPSCAQRVPSDAVACVDSSVVDVVVISVPVACFEVCYRSLGRRSGVHYPARLNDASRGGRDRGVVAHDITRRRSEPFPSAG